MAVDLGDVHPLTVDIKDANGVLANAGTVTLTITLPDLTTVTPAVTNPSTGRYQVDYPTVQAGRHQVRWLATGANASAFVDIFDVRPAFPAYLFSLADAKLQLNSTSTADDEELRTFIEATTAVVERIRNQAIVRRTIVEHRDLGMPPVHGAPGILQHFTLANYPVLSLTSVVAEDGGLIWNVADMKVTPAGVVEVLQGGIVWGPVVFTYEAGMTQVPAECGLGGRVILQHLWETQRGTYGAPRAGGLGETTTVLGYSIPNRAVELLGSAPSGFA